MEFEIKQRQMNVVAEAMINGKKVEFNYAHEEGVKPTYLSFRTVETIADESSLQGAYYAESKQLTLTINSMQEGDADVIEAIRGQCVSITTEEIED